jgi:hypothetical protein
MDAPKVGLDRSKTGRAKGTPNKTTALLKDAILKAAERAGNKVGDDGMVSYLEVQATENPGPFMSLLGKVLPMQITGEGGGSVQVELVKRVIVDARNPDS